MRFLLVLGMLAGAIFAQAEDPPKSLDPFDYAPEELVIQSGPLKGEVLKGDRRPVIEISDQERARLGLPDLGPGYLWVANFIEQPKFMGDGKKFHIAAIPLRALSHAVEEVVDRSVFNFVERPDDRERSVWQDVKAFRENWKAEIRDMMAVGPHFHAQMMFYFNEDILFFAQDVYPATGKLVSPEPIKQTTRNFAFAVGAARPEDFDPSMALKGGYRRLNLFAGEGEAHRDLIGGATIKQFRLDLSEGILAQILRAAVSESTEQRVSQVYNAMTDGCLSVTLRYLDWAYFLNPVHRFPYSWPNSPQAVMEEFRARGIGFTELEPIVPGRFKSKALPGPYSETNRHRYTEAARFVGRCSTLMSRLVTSTSIQLSGNR